MTALMRSPRLAVPWAALDRRAVAPRPSGPVELSGSAATRPGSSGAASRNHPAVSSHEASAEVCGVELNAPDRLVHRTELGHGEGRADEGSCDARDLELDPDALDRDADDSLVVEPKLDPPLEDVADGRERGMRSGGGRFGRLHGASDCFVRHRSDDP